MVSHGLQILSAWRRAPDVSALHIYFHTTNSVALGAGAIAAGIGRSIVLL